MRSSYTISLTNNTVGRWMYGNGRIQRSNIRIYDLVFKSDKKIHLSSSYRYFLPIILFGVECREMVEFNALTLGHMDSFVNQLKKFICDLHAHYPWSIILLGVECTKVVAFNALTSGHMNSYLNQLNNTFAIFIYNIPYQWYCWALNVRKW